MPNPSCHLHINLYLKFCSPSVLSLPLFFPCGFQTNDFQVTLLTGPCVSYPEPASSPHLMIHWQLCSTLLSSVLVRLSYYVSPILPRHQFINVCSLFVTAFGCSQSCGLYNTTDSILTNLKIVNLVVDLTSTHFLVQWMLLMPLVLLF